MTSELRETGWFHAYERAREAVLRMKRAAMPAGGAGDPSAYWTEELENIDYLIEATPLVVRKLRHHAFHITGIRPYDYRTKDDARRQHFEERLRALRELGSPSLLVPESPALGGFGYIVDGALLNVDTLKFYEVLVGMERGGVLQAIRSAERPVVCEIGAGWAGFAYQFKTLFPQATYVIVDFPELFLFSATYLGAVFPDARLHFVESNTPDALEGWRDADVVFVPHTLAGVVSSLPLDLTVNMVSFQEMTDAQVRGYADMAARANCPLLYSLNRERSPYNTELLSVSEALSERYRLTEVPVLDTDYTSAMKRPAKSGRLLERSPLSYRHLVGRLDRPAGQMTGARGRGSAMRADGAPTVVLGMTLYNNARHLREAMDSLLAQTFESFRLVLLDDASEDETEAIAREYVARDPRVRYVRHTTRAAMIATWREVAELAAREYPTAEYFAWVSDHDRWHPRWLERLLTELEADGEAVLAYPITRRLSADGDELDKGPRLFDTAHAADLAARWRAFCHKGAGSGDSVYGLMRLDALRRAGIFRHVLRPDRLLMAELTLYGRFRQVPEVLWYRRQAGASVDRQRQTLILEGEEPPWFAAPPSFQHTHVLWREYVKARPRPLPISAPRWVLMLARYQLTYGWRHFRKTGASHAVRRGIDLTILALKTIRRTYHHAVYWTLVNGRLLWGRSRRFGRKVLYRPGGVSSPRSPWTQSHTPPCGSAAAMTDQSAQGTGEAQGVSRSVALAVLAPVLGATLIVLVFVVMEIAGREPLSYGSPRNIAEAAGMGISSEVLRFLREGQDPAQVYPVRPEIISSSIRFATALEAAVWGRNGRLVRLLEREGALRPPEARQHMTCLAVHLEVEDLLSYLAPAGVTGCDPDATIALIEGRSR